MYMGFFNNHRKNISAPEFEQQVRRTLFAKDFTKREIGQIEMIFRADLYENSEYEKGIDQSELDQALLWMRSNMDKHDIPDYKIDVLEEILSEHLKD